MISLWSDSTTLPRFESLQGDIKTQVLIIGGGMAGVLCAHVLSGAGVDCVLAEADRICSGITKNTTAKITSQHGLIYDKLLKRFGSEKTAAYLAANQEAVKKYRALCQNIDCSLEKKDSFVYSVDDRKKIEKELNALEKIGFSAGFEEDLPLPIATAGAVKFSEQYQFNPLQFVEAISQGLPIFEHTTVRQLVGATAITDHGAIKADKIIVATHFPFINKHGSYFLKMYQHRSYVVALENAPDVAGMYVDGDHKGMSFRNAGELLLVGGGGHRTGKHGGGWQELTDFARVHYPQSSEKYRWATQDCMALDDVPYIGPYSARTPNLFVATGFNKWGMTSSMVAASILSDMVLEKKNPYADIFSPSRTILRPQLAINGFEAVTNLLTPSKKRCPHLGCALRWNKDERSWDCPCHGSRFTEDGNLIDNPSTGDL